MLAALLAPQGAYGDTLPEHADEVVAYRISVTLDATTHRLTGREHVEWRNRSSEPVSELWFHLYLNAFKNDRSTFFRESGGQLRGDRCRKTAGAGSTSPRIRARRRRRPRATHPLRAARRRQHGRSDGGTGDAAGAGAAGRPRRARHHVSRRSCRASSRARATRTTSSWSGSGSPSSAVYEPAGMRGRAAGGWNCHQFHANSEFYADFGRYEVEITVPARFVVGATGRRTGRAARQRRRHHDLHATQQEDVHDFAWTADPDFIELRRTFSADARRQRRGVRATAQLLGRSLDEVRLSRRGDHPAAPAARTGRRPQRHLEAAVLGLKWFGLWYGRYPYRTLTVVDPAPGGGGAGGMEYPTFITGGTSFLLNRVAPQSGARCRGGHGARVRSPVSGMGSWPATSSRRRGSTKGCNTYSTAKVTEKGYGSDETPGRISWGSGSERARACDSPTAASRIFDKVRQPAWIVSGRL